MKVKIFPVSVNGLLLVNLVLLTSNVSKYVQLEMKGAASSSTPVSFKTRVRSCGGPWSAVSGNKPTRQAERKGCMAPRLKDFRNYQRWWKNDSVPAYLASPTDSPHKV